MVKARLIVVDEYRGGDMHGIYKDQPFLNAAFMKAIFNFRRDVYKFPSLFHFKPKLFSV